MLSGIPNTGMDTGIEPPSGILVFRPYTCSSSGRFCGLYAGDSGFEINYFVGKLAPLTQVHFFNWQIILLLSTEPVSPPNLASAPILQSFCELRQTTFILCLNH